MLALVELAHQRQLEAGSHVLDVGNDLQVALVPARVSRHILDRDLDVTQRPLAAAVPAHFYIESYYTAGRYPLSFRERRFLVLTPEEFRSDRLPEVGG